MGVLPLIFDRMNLQTSKEYKAAKALEDAMNDYGWSPERFADSIPCMHRTIQQTLIRTIVEVIIKVGSDNYSVDPRNKVSHELCRNIVTSGLLSKLLLSGKTQNDAKTLREAL